MKISQLTLSATESGETPRGRIDPHKVDSTTNQEVARQQASDEQEAMQDMARYAKRVRKRLGLTQLEFAQRIEVPIETIRNWEQGKRYPTGAAKALLKILDKAPETAISALD